MDSRKLVVSVSLAVSIIGIVVWLVLSGLGDDDGSTQNETGSSSSEKIVTETTETDVAGVEAENDVAKVVTEKESEADTDEEPPEVVDDRPISLEGTITSGDDEPVLEGRIIVLHRVAWEGSFDAQKDRMNDDPFGALRELQSTLDELALSLPSAKTDDKGYYAVRGLEEGEHRVFVLHEDFLAHRDRDRCRT
jgi:hypothetical protein